MAMTPEAYARAAASIRAHEGLRLKPYKDTTGHLSLGYGRNLSANGIREVEAEHLLANDLSEAIVEVSTAYPWVAILAPARQAVVVELMFNLGPSRLAKFRPTLDLLRQGDYAGAGGRLRRSKWAGQVGRRAEHLITQLVTGAWWQA
jgi:lysozyme